MNKINISVVVPVRNGSTVLPACLEGLRTQTYPHESFEVIVVDDGSSDSTVSVVERIAREWVEAENSPLLRLVVQDWRGAGAARNRGVSEAHGEIVAFTDADCEPLPDWISSLVEPFKDPSVAIVAGGYLTRQKEAVARLAQAEFEQRYRYLKKHETIDIAFTHSAAFRIKVFQLAGGFDERMPNNADDLELSYRLARAGHRIIYAPNALVYHLHPSNLVEYAKKKWGRGYWRMVVYKRYPDKALKDTYTPQMLKLQIGLTGISAASLTFALFGPDWLVYVGLLSVFILVLTMLPFILGLKGSIKIKLLAPLFLVLRAGALGGGVLFGMLDRIERYDTGGKRLSETSARQR